MIQAISCGHVFVETGQIDTLRNLLNKEHVVVTNSYNATIALIHVHLFLYHLSLVDFLYHQAVKFGL